MGVLAQGGTARTVVSLPSLSLPNNSKPNPSLCDPLLGGKDLRDLQVQPQSIPTMTSVPHLHGH